ncbi:N-alkane-inducible cytochrome P450 [Neohortaea acidophila]|uniref:N-alkane-inducible cytochrome P450 n=1 Tax=Neohortaea acidophila TaxID=245834 RepID=A0A6A6Q5A0_9PEZI|nr:N-alkane-inducible cytochrome P450 [Neohortaea acidophila]KAF2487472.1 N-alkane-inducible cytochrome P450 [Neohortaea acidophila]
MKSFLKEHARNALLFALLLLLCVRILDSLRTQRKNRALAHSRNCVPPPEYATRYYGVSSFLAAVQAAKSHRLLEVNRARFLEIGAKTYTMLNLGQRMTYTMSPDNLKAILATDFQSWGIGGRRKDSWGRALGSGVFTTDGVAWKHSRSLLKPSFSKKDIGNLPMFEQHVASLISVIKQAGPGATLDLGNLFSRMTTDFATEYLLGEPTQSLLKGSDDHFLKAFDACVEHIGYVSRVGKLAELFDIRHFRRQRKFVNDYIDSYIEQKLVARLEKPDKSSLVGKEERHTFLDELLQQTTDRIVIRSELLNILVAGRDTTAGLLTNTFHILSRRPEVVARLREEIDAVVPRGSKPDIDSLKRLQYLSAILNESLRVFPVVPFNSRESLVPTVLPRGGGSDGSAPMFIPAGHTVIWSSYAMQRDPDVYGADAEVFNPDRWIDSGPESSERIRTIRSSFSYTPFGGGPRLCLGQELVMTEVKYIMTRLFQEFRSVESRDDRPWTEKFGVTCVNRYGADCAFRW